MKLFSINLVVLLLCVCAHAAILKVNVGGGALDDDILADSGKYQVSDGIFIYSKPGSTVYNSHASVASGDLIYSFPAATGKKVKATLQFAEIYEGCFFEGSRVLDVFINDVPIAEGLDVFAEAGPNAAKDISHTLTVEDGFVEVRIVGVGATENPMLSGFILEEIGESDADILKGDSEDSASSETDAAVMNNEEIEIGGDVVLEEDSFTEGSSISPNQFYTVPVENYPPTRHENCGVFCNSKYYLIGGRRLPGVWAFDPMTRTWSEGTNPWQELHHMQCVCWNKKVYLVGSWYGPYPNETAYEEMFVYDTESDEWSSDLKNPSGERLRGAAAVAVHDDKIYMASGSTGGHGPSTTLKNYTDVFDLTNPDEGWKPLADFPGPRDHAGGAIVGDLFCVAAGRNGSSPNFFADNVRPIYCLDISKPESEWIQMADLPEPRGGVSVGATCNGYIMIAGGESLSAAGGKAYDRVDLFDPSSDSFVDPPVRLQQARHGTTLGVTDCSCGNIYIGSGSGNLGAIPELNDTEVWSPMNTRKIC